MREQWKRIFLCCVMVVCLNILLTGTADAAGKYKVTKNDAGDLILTDQGELMKKEYVSLKKSGTKYKVVEPGKKGSKVYYFDEDGIGEEMEKSQFVKITYNGKKKEYYIKDGAIVKNKIVGNKKQGYYYVDPTGVKVTDKTTKLAVKFVRDHSKDTDSRSEKLKKCYYYLAGHYKYSRTYVNLYPKADSMQSLAYDMLSCKAGNCHRYAASFAYIAKVLGYDARVVVGNVSSRHGGMTPHGWDEIKVDGKWYVFDPDMEVNNHVASYMKSSTPCRTTVTRRCTITAKNGKVKWK